MSELFRCSVSTEKTPTLTLRFDEKLDDGYLIHFVTITRGTQGQNYSKSISRSIMLAYETLARRPTMSIADVAYAGGELTIGPEELQRHVRTFVVDRCGFQDEPNVEAVTSGITDAILRNVGWLFPPIPTARIMSR